MFPRNSRVIINGGCSRVFKSLVNCSTMTKLKQPHSYTLSDFLMNSLGFSKEAAFTASSKVIRAKPIKEKPNLVVNYLGNLGLDKTQIKKIVSASPQLLFYNVEKTLVPKIEAFRELGLSELDVVKVVSGHKSLLVRGLDTFIKPRIEYFRKLFESDDRVAAAVKRYALKTYKLEIVKQNVFLLQNIGFTNDIILDFIVKDPKNILFARAEKVRDILHRVESYLGIPRDSAMYHYGVHVLSSFGQSNIDEKLGVFKSFGWSEADILEMVGILPLILCISAERMRKGLDFFMKELGYKPEYLASRPVLLSLNLERRVKPRLEVLKILNEKKLNRRKAALYTVLMRPDSKFVKDYILPYKKELPDLHATYLKYVRMPKVEKSLTS